MPKRIMTALILLLFKQLNGQSPLSTEELLQKLSVSRDDEKPALYRDIAFSYMAKDRFDSALHYNNLGLGMALKLNNERAAANAHNNIGLIYRVMGDYEKAMDAFVKALKLYGANGMEKEMAKTTANMAFVYKERQQFGAAIDKLKQAAAVSYKLADTVFLISLWSDLADTYSVSGSLKEAREYADKAVAVLTARMRPGADAPPDSIRLMYAKSFLNRVNANIYTQEGHYLRALHLYRLEWADAKHYNTSAFNKIDITAGLADIYYKTNQYDSAQYYATLAFSFQQMERVPYAKAKLHELKARILYRQGRFKEAYDAFEIFKSVSDSINNDKARGAVAEIQGKYEFEKKDNTIAGLHRQQHTQKIIIILAAGSALLALSLLLLAYRSKRLQGRLYKEKEQRLLTEKEIEKKQMQQQMNELEQMALRSQMNPHFIFNSLNSVQHFVMRQDIEGVNKYLGTFAHLVRQMLHHSGSRLVSLDEETKFLETYLALEQMKSNNRFNYSVTISGEIDRSATFIPAMILQPFVENSIRHGVAYRAANDGRVSISVYAKDKLFFEVEDNGIGRQKTGSIGRGAAHAGFESKGMAITMKRVEALNSIYETDISVQVDDVAGENGDVAGTRVTICFPPGIDQGPAVY